MNYNLFWKDFLKWLFSTRLIRFGAMLIVDTNTNTQAIVFFACARNKKNGRICLRRAGPICSVEAALCNHNALPLLLLPLLPIPFGNSSNDFCELFPLAAPSLLRRLSFSDCNFQRSFSVVAIDALDICCLFALVSLTIFNKQFNRIVYIPMSILYT